jgi:GAF domain-containing protein
MAQNEPLLVRTLVELADTLVDDFDVVDLLTLLVERCVQIVDVAAAGLMLATESGELQSFAATSVAMRNVELFEVQSDEGPCVECYRTGEPVVNQDLTAADDRWPRFAAMALGSGFRSAHALPMRLRGKVIGAMGLFRAETVALDEREVFAVQALADVATIAILQHRLDLESHLLVGQLNAALASRVVIEQAKGVISERADVGIDEAFARLRQYARSHNLRLTDVAIHVTEGRLEVEAFARTARAPRPPRQ